MADSLKNMRDLLEQRKVAKLVPKEETLNFDSIISFEHWFEELPQATSEDQKFLIEKSKELLNMNVKGILLTGKVLTEVFDHFGKKGSPEGFYLKFLECHNIEPRKALRHRHRWELYQKAPEKAKLVVATLTIREIEELYKNQELLGHFSHISLEEAKKLLQKQNLVIAFSEEQEREEIFFYSFLDKKYQKKLSSLEEEKKKLAFELLEKLEELLK